MRRNRCLLLGLVLFALTACSTSEDLQVQSRSIKICWEETPEGWKVERFAHRNAGEWGVPDGAYTILYSAEKPDKTPVQVYDRTGDPVNSDIARFHCIASDWDEATSSVPMNRAGETVRCYPQRGWREGKTVCFEAETAYGRLVSKWQPDPDFKQDIRVEITFYPAKQGYYSLATPSLATLCEERLGWSVVPGFFQGDYIQPTFHLAYMYGQGLPHLPVVCNENTVTTMMSVMTEREGAALAMIPDGTYTRDEYLGATRTHGKLWRCGLSHMNRQAELTPTLYYPVLGEDRSLMEGGDSVQFVYRVAMSDKGWYDLHQHTIYDLYGLKKSMALRKTTMPLYKRMEAIWDYVVNDSLSLWRTADYRGVTIGAQAYLGAVVESERDAMKNADVGAAWMLAAMTGDERLTATRLPYMRNFKLMQQASAEDPNHGAALGQYYLMKKSKFVEEWGDHIEPIGTTYYTLMDLGNILLFEPEDSALRECFRAGAERLLSLQREDGGFVVAYGKQQGEPLFTDLEDLRPTFYGFVVAYRLLGEQKYLDAAVRGADWFIRRAVNRGAFTGVCGDARFINDFATGQAVQALLDVYELTGRLAYREAALRTAQFYTTSIYTHPMASDRSVEVNGKNLQQWQISQVGLCFEHGGCAGSAVGAGPILLTSHCALFVRLYALTGDRLYLDMARAAATAREAHLASDTHIATYYWGQFDRGPGPFPHHAWWQLGWIADYLLAEAELRSDGKISFPRGFMTPKVGPQQVFGFASGTIYGEAADWILNKGLFEVDNMNVEVLAARTTDGKGLYLVLMNSSPHVQNLSLKVHAGAFTDSEIDMASCRNAATGRTVNYDAEIGVSVQLPEYGMLCLKMNVNLK